MLNGRLNLNFLFLIDLRDKLKIHWKNCLTKNKFVG